MAFIVGFNLSETLVTSSANFAVAYAVGLMQAWGILWSGTLLVWMSPQFEAERVEKRKRTEGTDDASSVVLNGSTTGGNGSANGHVLTNGHVSNGNAHSSSSSSSITSVGGAVDGNFSQRKGHQISLLDAPDEDVARSLQEGYEYYWQAYPADAPFSTRFEWSLDLVSSFRGTGKRSSVSRSSPTVFRSRRRLIGSQAGIGVSRLFRILPKLRSLSPAPQSILHRSHSVHARAIAVTRPAASGFARKFYQCSPSTSCWTFSLSS